MNYYRMSHSSQMSAHLHADKLRREGALDVRITEMRDGWDVVWRQA